MSGTALQLYSFAVSEPMQGTSGLYQTLYLPKDEEKGTGFPKG